MFNNQEVLKISEAITGTWLLVNNQALSDVALDIFLDDVECYPFLAVMTAIRNARKQAKGRVSVGDIMQCLSDLDGRPSADEAWAIASQVLDESATVVWNDEIMQAWSIACPLLEMGDKFNAARAFKEKYEQVVDRSRSNNIAVKWLANIGTDNDLRQRAIEQALSKKIITHTQAKHWLPNHVVSEGAYAAIKSNVSLMIENKSANSGHVMLERSEELRRAAQVHQDRIAELKKAAGVEAEARPDGAKSKRDSLAIFEDAERLGVFKNDKERKEWCAKAANGENLKGLQALMLIAKSARKAGAA